MKPVLSEEIEVQTVELVRLVPDRDVSAVEETRAERLRRVLLDRLPFLLIVVVPTLLAAIYFFALAVPRYVSEVKFVVRTPSSAATSELASLVSGSNVTRSADDAYLAKEFMLSRDLMAQLLQTDGLAAVFAGARWDILWRFPGPFRTPTQEDMAKHFERFVSIEYDSSSGISTLSMQAFDPADAKRLAGAILYHTEGFLNALNGRAQHDAIQSAVRDVETAKQTAYASLDAMTAFRNTQATLDPTKASTGIVQSISSLSLETSSTNARLAELMTTAPQSPEIPGLRTRVAALQAQIVKQRQQLGGDADSLAPQIAQYQRLLLDQQFAEKAFISALTSLESARLDASRQRVFLEPVTEPDLPDRPAYPYRISFTLLTFVVSLAIWRVLSTIGKDTREHVGK